MGTICVIRLWNVPKAGSGFVLVNAIDINGVLLGNQMLPKASNMLLRTSNRPKLRAITVFHGSLHRLQRAQPSSAWDTTANDELSVTAVLILWLPWV